MSEEIFKLVNDIYSLNYFGMDNEGLPTIAGLYYKEITEPQYYGESTFEEDVKYSENKAEYIINYSIDIAKKYLNELRTAVEHHSGRNDIPDDAIVIAAASELYKTIHDELIKHKAYNYADDFAKSEDNIEKYDSKHRAWNKGYDKYLEGNIMSFYACVDRVASLYYERQNSPKL